MTAGKRAAAAGARLALGTGLAFHQAGAWLAPEDSGRRCAARLAGTAGALVFLGPLLVRAPHLIYAVPLGWLGLVWHMSGSSAPPPPLPTAPLTGVTADEMRRGVRVVRSPEGVLCTLHPVGENAPQKGDLE